MTTERTKNSFYNSLSNLFCSVTVTIFSFVVRTVFIKYLGEQCLGVDGLFTNILSLLSLAELGISSAIGFSLYEPLAKKNIDEINRLMNYYRNVYKKIGIFILAAGILILPFIKFFVHGYTIDYNLYLIFILYLLNTSFSYFTTFSTTLIESDQKLYKLTKIKFVFNMLVYGVQLLIIIYTKNFILYLVCFLVLRQIERIITYYYIKHSYKQVDFRCKKTISANKKDEINKNVKGILFHKIGEYAVNGTDNILISSIVNIAITGIYANYLSIISVFKTLINSVISSTTSSFGNLNVMENEKVKENIFNVINFVSCYTAGFVFLGLYFCINPLIDLWLGSDYLLSSVCVVVICVNFYLSCILLPVNVVKNSSGLFFVDRYIAILQAIINLGVSIILGFKFGILGILLGTLFSNILTVNITKPYIIYKYVFKTSILKYFKFILKNVSTILIVLLIETLLFKLYIVNSNLLKILIYGSFSTICYGLLATLLNYKSKEVQIIIESFFKKKVK